MPGQNLNKAYEDEAFSVNEITGEPDASLDEVQRIAVPGSKAEKFYDNTLDEKDEKKSLEHEVTIENLPGYSESLSSTGKVEYGGLDPEEAKKKVQTSKGIVTSAFLTDDDPSENAWTFRSLFLGIGLSIFGSVLAEIYYFKPQTIIVSTIFLILLAYLFGELFAFAIPRNCRWKPMDRVLKFLNPHPFNLKEHAAIFIMSSASAQCSLGTEVLAVQRLWYPNLSINPAVGIFMLFSSQTLGYGLVGIMRRALVYPTQMFYPLALPAVSTLQTLHKNHELARKGLRIFIYCFLAMFFWEIVPEYIFGMLVGFSIPCLAAPKSYAMSLIFGGTGGNEGLGLLSFCFDWQYIASTENPLAMPLKTTINNLIGYILCICVFCGMYWGNVWRALDFPFLSQELFYNNATREAGATVFNQTFILTADNILNVTALEEVGVPYMTPTYVTYLIATNLSVGGTFTYMILCHWDTVKNSFGWLHYKELARFITKDYWVRFFDSKYDGRLDKDGKVPKDCDDEHFRAMLVYKEVPIWWYISVLLLSGMVALICLYEGHSGLPWWCFIIACILAYVFSTFLGGLVALYGFGGTQMQTIIQLIGSYIHPYSPMANMYFTLYGYNAVQQAFAMMTDLKTGHYVKLSPRSTFAAQMLGTIIGAIFNFIMMQSIVTNQKDALLSVQGTIEWSGQNVQQYNTQGIAWGALAKFLFSHGMRYQWVSWAIIVGFALPFPTIILHRYFPKAGFDSINLPILVWFIGWLCVGVNSSITTYFIIAFASQWWFRKYHPDLFLKYNYVIAAGLSGGTQVLVFILSFAVFGASGESHLFPNWWGGQLYSGGDPDNTANYDHCLYTN